jgi:hypothetical protein
MKKFAFPVAVSLAIMLAACGGGEEDSSNSADDFAARINGEGGAPAVDATNAPVKAEPLPGAAEGAYTPGTLTDPNSSVCGANLMGPFIGKEADSSTRLAVMDAVREAGKDAGNVRFVAPGSATVQPDPTNPRLNLMIDNLGVIRDARCG